MTNSKIRKGWPVWATEKIEIADPNPNWELMGEKEKDGLKQLLGEFNIIEFEHIGSTAIPGLPAKPIIDIMAMVLSFDETDKITLALKPYHWNYVPPELDGDESRRYFVKVLDNKRVAHLQLILKGSERWDNYIKFREALINNPALLNEYALLKIKLAASYPEDREAYTLAKSGFVQKVINC